MNRRVCSLMRTNMSLLINCLALNYILSRRIFGCQEVSMMPVYIKEGRATEVKKEEVMVNWFYLDHYV